ncbi:MAG: DUF4931 domain-containing protein [Patescibacteria group bacterium]
MSDLRSSILSPDPVLIATNRNNRPNDFTPGEKNLCPFCPGNEELTAQPELFRINSPFNHQWELRTVPNLYYAIGIEGDSQFLPDSEITHTILNAHGAHNVIIDTPNHNEDFSLFPLWRFINLFQAIVFQTNDLNRDKNIRFIRFFKNHLLNAGASLEHSHTQIIALPQIPQRALDRLAKAFEYEAKHGVSVFNLLLQRVERDQRVVIKSQYFICQVPYDALFPYEMWIVPLFNHAYFAESKDFFDELALVMAETFRRLKAVNGGSLPALNCILDEMPADFYQNANRFYRWRWIIMPRLTAISGPQLFDGLYVNPLPPEIAAKQLREAKID